MSNLDRLDIMAPFDIQAAFVQDELDRPDVAELVKGLRLAKWRRGWVIHSLAGLYVTMLLEPPEHKKILRRETEEEAMAAARVWIEEVLEDKT